MQANRTRERGAWTPLAALPLAALLAMSTAIARTGLVDRTGTRAGVASAQTANDGAPGDPNIVIVMSDDQRWDTVNARYMPNLTNLVMPHGVWFDEAFVSNPLCCPSRVTTLTGKYSYTTGVYGNSGPWGGYGASVRYGAMNDTIATDLHRDGYTTALVGKYLNGYDAATDYLTKPPGWDRWFEVNTGVYYDYSVAVDGMRSLHHGSSPADYITRVLQARALSFIRSTATPFFLYFATTAPHSQAIPDPRDSGRFDLDVQRYVHPPTDPEVDLGDKPNYIRRLAWDRTIQSSFDAFHARQLAAIYGVDRAIGAIWKALPDNTILLFMSDNGYEWGEHGWHGKMVPYNESLRVPMLIASKGVDLSAIGAVGGSSSRLVLNVDIRASLGSFVRDLPQQPTTDGEPWTGDQRRGWFPIMHWNDDGSVPVYCGVRSEDWMYVRYGNRTEEAYDEQADPYEQNNLFVTDPTSPQLDVLRMQAARSCSPRPGRVYPGEWPY